VSLLGQLRLDPWRFVRPLVFQRPPEEAHALALKALAAGMVRPIVKKHPKLSTNVAGLTFPNPVGIAAGFDKNGEVPMEMLGQGFGFIEVGTTTPRPQAGNPKPRVFRLVQDEAMINRLGFNNEGHDALARRFEFLPPKGQRPGIIGVNIGANKDSKDRIDDYVCGVKRFASVADYITINISSPNTPGLRDLQGKEALHQLVSDCLEVRERTLEAGTTCPLFVKIAPDLNTDELLQSLDVIEQSAVEGVIVSNTTNARPISLHSPEKKQAGGLSGRPLFEPSTAMLSQVRDRLGRSKALIGVGGVDSAQTAIAKLEAGADLVQLYTGYVFQGPGLISRMLDGLDRHPHKHLDRSVEQA
jgi:dihydroorotate dehydrogenase